MSVTRNRIPQNSTNGIGVSTETTRANVAAATLPTPAATNGHTAKVIKTRFDLQTHINTEKPLNPARQPHIVRWASWMRHGIQHGMHTVQWEQIGLPELPAPAPQPTPDIVSSDTPAPVEQRYEGFALRADAELTRLGIALDYAGCTRLYILMRELSRQGKGRNSVDKKTLFEGVKAHGIKCGWRNYQSILTDGNGVFWRVYKRRVYHFSPARVARNLTTLALEAGHAGMVTKDRPGRRDMYIRVDGSLQQFEAFSYNAWIADNENPTISRAELELLWNRSAKQLRTWETVANIQSTPNELHTRDLDDPRIPQPFQSKNGQTYHRTYPVRFEVSPGTFELGIAWRIANSYQAAPARQHPRKGQAFKTRRAVNQVIDDLQHLIAWRDSSEDAPVKVIHFDDGKAFERFQRRSGTPSGIECRVYRQRIHRRGKTWLVRELVPLDGWLRTSTDMRPC